MRAHFTNLPVFVLRLLLSPAGRVLILSTTCWLAAFVFCRYEYSRDPHSAFFKSEHVYDLKYSNFREQQATRFLSAATERNTSDHVLKEPPEICAAFVTVKRDIQYIDAAIGSLLEGLTSEERNNLYLHVLFANPDPEVHPTYQQPWLHILADSAAGYNVTDQTLEHLRGLEKARNFYEKGVFDYTYALDRCYEIGSPYILMLEDDVIIADGWMAKTRQALLDVEALSQEEKRNWIYLRLFYTETSMSWQDTDFWYENMYLTFGLASAASFIFFVLLRSQSIALRKHLDNWALAVLCLATIPAFVALLFMIGKYSLFPLAGVFEQNLYGCCTQALVFPRMQAGALTTHLRNIGTGQTDTMIEKYADENGLSRFALAPQLVQHIGLQSSRDNTFINSQSTWAFYFELYDPAKLRLEHSALVG
ncbi:hypothetical protein PVAG01_04753 [Phlyctema vagabunda]|uniref:Integral membrane protein n=1 Tax=Phlyctema vagabunda TaxID=108571 RepID=A0ABR4PIS1_9HELO